MAGIDKKKLEILLQSMGGRGPSIEQMKMMEALSSKYKGKKEDEIKEELKKLNDSMKQDKEKYEKNMKMLDEIKNFLDDEQKKKLEYLIDFLKEEEK